MVRGEKTVGFLVVERGENTLTSIPKLYVIFLRRREIQQGEQFRIQGARENDKPCPIALTFRSISRRPPLSLEKFLVLVLPSACWLNCHRYLGVYSYKQYEMSSPTKVLLLQKLCPLLI